MNRKAIKYICALGLGVIGCMISCQSNIELSDKEGIALQEMPDTIASTAASGVVNYKGVWYSAGDTIFGYKNYVKLVVGSTNVPLLLGAPHDGVLTGDPVIPETGTTLRDMNIKPLVFAISKLFKQDTGLQPWIVINEISRKRMDPNSLPTAYTVGSEARKSHDSYHELILLARTTMAGYLQNRIGGLIIDMHGHGHKYAPGREEGYASIIDGIVRNSEFIDQSELGYLLAAATYDKTDTDLNAMARYSSIYGLFKAHPSVTFAALVRGPYSFGGFLREERVWSVPSNVLPNLVKSSVRFGVNPDGTAKRRPYYSGGYVTKKYGTSELGSSTVGFADNISAIQIETPRLMIRDNAEVIKRSSHKFKRAIIKYLNKWYGYNFSNSSYPYTYYSFPY